MRPLSPLPKLPPEKMAEVWKHAMHPDFGPFINRANEKYYHWEELRRRPPPAGLTAEQAWWAVKSSRFNRRSVSLKDTSGRNFSYATPDHAQKILHVVDRQGGGALATDDGTAATFSEMRDRILVDSLMEEAIATSQIEGAVTTRRVAKDLLRSGRKPKDRSEKMIVNGYRTVRLLRERIDRPLSFDMLHEIQESMTRDTLPDADDVGRFRTASDNVHIVDARDEQIIFTPPPASMLHLRLTALIDFANEDPQSGAFIHPLIRAAIVHFWLAYEHPYVDGNGRTARALFYWMMLRRGYWLFEFLTISRIIHAAPMRYYRSFLYTETDDNDLTYFLLFQLEVTQKALTELHTRLHELSDEQKRMSAIRIAAKLNARQRALLDHASRHPHQLYTFESHQKSHQISYQTARTDLLGLADLGLLKQSMSLRPIEFFPAGDLRRKLTAYPRHGHP